MISLILRDAVTWSCASPVSVSRRWRTSCWVMVEAPRARPRSASRPAETMPTGSKPELSQNVRSSTAVVASTSIGGISSNVTTCAVEVAEAGELRRVVAVPDHRLLRAARSARGPTDPGDRSRGGCTRSRRRRRPWRRGGSAPRTARGPSSAADTDARRARGLRLGLGGGERATAVVVHRAEVCGGSADRASGQSPGLPSARSRRRRAQPPAPCHSASQPAASRRWASARLVGRRAGAARRAASVSPTSVERDGIARPRAGPASRGPP